MTKLRITFINSETLDINQSTLLDLAVYEKENYFNMSPRTTQNIALSESSHSYGPISIKDIHGSNVIMSLLNFLHSSDFFYVHNQPETIYASSSIYKIEQKD
ncbi:hypothetical protein ACPUD3_09565 [Leuconostoc mesenteroides subsp. dextranicum]|uniref:hypothetical protein n=1 Tax=Leuconostoc mesenteroides TaxID=1245 RepID=UPI003CC18295